MEANFGSALKSERRRLDQSLRQFADFIGTSVSTLKRWESGQALPPEAKRESIFDLIQGAVPTEPETDGIHFGWLLKIERIAASCSIRQAADRSLIPPSAWHRYETGQSPLGRNQAKRLIRLLRGPIDEPDKAPDPSELPTIVMEQPMTAARVLASHLLSASSCDFGPSLNRFEAYRTFAFALMHIGDHHLSGLAYRIAVRYGVQDGVSKDDIAVSQISSAWRGYPEITNRALAASRLQWIDKKVSSLPADRRIEFATMRAMFIDWAGYPQLASDVLRLARRDGLSELSLAWIEAKYGQPMLAVSLAEPFLEHENANYRFIANKVLLESYWGIDDFELAKEPMARLIELRSSRGFWSPDLSARQKKLAAQ